MERVRRKSPYKKKLKYERRRKKWSDFKFEEMFPPEILIEMFNYIFLARCQRGLNSLKRVSRLFNYLLCSKKFIDYNPKCSDANYPALKYSKIYSKEDPICCLGKLYSLYHKQGINVWNDWQFHHSGFEQISGILIGIPKFTYAEGFFERPDYYYQRFVDNNIRELSEECVTEIFKEMLKENPKNVFHRLLVFGQILKKYYPQVTKLKSGSHILDLRDLWISDKK